MFCGKCGTNNPDGSAMCGNCGAPLGGAQSGFNPPPTGLRYGIPGSRLALNGGTLAGLIVTGIAAVLFLIGVIMAFSVDKVTIFGETIYDGDALTGAAVVQLFAFLAGLVGTILLVVCAKGPNKSTLVKAAIIVGALIALAMLIGMIVCFAIAGGDHAVSESDYYYY